MRDNGALSGRIVFLLLNITLNRVVPEMLTAKEVAGRLRIGVRTLYRLVRAGVVPKPIRLSRKILLWPEGEIDRFLKDREGGTS